jgi:hypothetical protein
LMYVESKGLKPGEITAWAQGFENQALSSAMGQLDSTCTGAPPRRRASSDSVRLRATASATNARSSSGA